MSTTLSHQINRSFIEKLVRKGQSWVESNLAMEKRMLKTCLEEEKQKHEVYIMALEKAMKEFN